jgi:excisionase family DNA binding protein
MGAHIDTDTPGRAAGRGVESSSAIAAPPSANWSTGIRSGPSSKPAQRLWIDSSDTAGQVRVTQLVNERTLRRHIATGDITGYRLGRIYRIDLNELDQWLKPIPTGRTPR